MLAHLAPLAHILQNAPLPVALGWVAASLVGLGGLGIFRGRGTRAEVAGWIAFGAGFCGVAAVVGLTAILPTSAAVSITMAAPHSGAVTSPLQVAICARSASDGAVASAPDGTNVLAVVLDGHELAVEHTGSFAVPVPHGRHHLRVELLTRDHVEFSPPMVADADVDVSGDAPLAAAAPCPAA